MIGHECIYCRAWVNTPVSMAGGVTICPACGRNIPVPARPWAMRAWRRLAAEVRRFPQLRWWAVGGLMIAWLLTFRGPPSPMIALNYGCLAAAAALTAGGAMRRLGRPRLRWWRQAASAAVVAVVWFCAARADRCDVDYSIEGGRVIETRARWTGRPIWRRVDFKDLNYIEGPVTPTGKPHGLWEGWDWGAGRRVRYWFWHGESVTEGEFYLREK